MNMYAELALGLSASTMGGATAQSGSGSLLGGLVPSWTEGERTFERSLPLPVPASHSQRCRRRSIAATPCPSARKACS